MKTKILTVLLLCNLGLAFTQSPLSLFSRISDVQTSSMTISRNDQNGVIVTTNLRNANKDERFKIYIYNGPTYANGVITIPSNGKTYWAINFNPSVQNPVKLISFGSITADCHCPVRGGCDTEVCAQAYEEDGLIICPPGACSGFDAQEDCGSCDLPDAIVIIDADVVYYNGTQYRKK